MTTSTDEVTGGLLTYKDVAELLSVSESGVRQMVSRRQIPHLRLGRRVRFDPNELNAWVASQRVPAS